MPSCRYFLLRATLSAICVVFIFAKKSSAISAQPKWGSKISPFQIKDSKEFTRLNKLLGESMKEFLTQNLYNTIDDFIDFHNQYKIFMSTSSSNSFETFYLSFTPKMRNPAITHVEKLIKHISTKVSRDSSFQNICKSMYTVSVERHVPKTLIESLKKNNAQPRMKKMYDVMACLSISINTNVGYIIMDPVKGYPNPIIVMHTGQASGAPHTGIIEYDDEQVEFITMDTNKDYVYTWSSDDNDNIAALIYAAFPYLSISEFTHKPSLLQPYRALIRRNRDGKEIASVSFKAVPKFRFEQNIKVCDATFKVSVKSKVTTILFESILHGNTTLSKDLSTKIYEAIQEGNEELKLKSGQLLEILTELGKVMEDYEFLASTQHYNQYVL